MLRASRRRVAQGQAAYYLVTGIWPLVAPRSFQTITGRKHDFWLAQTAGALIGVAGMSIGLAARERQALDGRAIHALAVGSALSLAAVDIVFVARRRISPVYLADAVTELAFVAGWALSHLGRRSAALPRPRYIKPLTGVAGTSPFSTSGHAAGSHP